MTGDNAINNNNSHLTGRHDLRLRGVSSNQTNSLLTGDRKNSPMKQRACEGTGKETSRTRKISGEAEEMPQKIGEISGETGTTEEIVVTDTMADTAISDRLIETSTTTEAGTTTCAGSSRTTDM